MLPSIDVICQCISTLPLGTEALSRCADTDFHLGNKIAILLKDMYWVLNVYQAGWQALE